MSEKQDNYSCISPNGYVVNFDTQKRRRYTDRQEEEMVSLKFNGMSVRNIAKEMKLPSGSIHYILRKYGCVSHNDSKPGLSWLNRSECFWQYDMSSKSFDYVKEAYPEYYKKVGNRVYIHHKYISEYYLGHKAYHDREDLRRSHKKGELLCQR